jgi:AcrR family transcriptional regulator
VYRHFPDDEALFDACTAHYFARHPMPDPGEWTAIGPPDERFRRALEDLYAWYGETEQMLFNSIRDIERAPVKTRERFFGYFVGVQAALMEGRPDRGRARARVSAAIGHAIGFGTWRSITREQGLENDEAVALMTAMVQKSGPDRPTAQLARRASAVR